MDPSMYMMNQQFQYMPQMMQNNNVLPPLANNRINNNNNVSHNNHKMDSKKENKGKSQKPKGRMSAYTFFVQTCREEHRKKHPDENVNFIEFSKKCAERWKQMNEKEKTRFAEMAEKDKSRYDREMSSYTPPAGEGGRKRKKKDPNAPKRPLSAFFLFCHDERPAVKVVYPTYSVGEFAKELGERWSKVTPEQKSKYEERVGQDKQRYEKEMANYKNKKANPVACVEEDDDEDDEEDDE